MPYFQGLFLDSFVSHSWSWVLTQELLMYAFIYLSQQASEIGTDFGPILQVRKLRLHSSFKWQS